jgi:hypothetical protein
MTTRIQELAKCNERVQNFFETGPVQRAAIEDFADLIVFECIKIAVFRGDAATGKAIKEHFGVEW